MLCLLTVALAGCVGSSSAGRVTLAAVPRGSIVARPNIVFILTDDLSDNLVPYMPNLVALEKRGVDVHELLRERLAVLPEPRPRSSPGCCPHDSGVYTNGQGFATFVGRGDTERTYALALARQRLPDGDDGQISQRVRAHLYDGRTSRTFPTVGRVGRDRERTTASSTTPSTRIAGSFPTARPRSRISPTCSRRLGSEFVSTRRRRRCRSRTRTTVSSLRSGRSRSRSRRSRRTHRSSPRRKMPRSSVTSMRRRHPPSTRATR